MNPAALPPVLDLAGTAVFALTGALLAARLHQTFVTMAFFALVTGVGGGSVRDLLLGRRTYDIFAGYWPQVASDAPHGAIADAFNAATKHVATHRPDTLAWAHSHALDGDVVDALRALKRTDGPDLVIQGSSVLLHQLLARDVVDELRLLVYPIVLGRGKRLFDDRGQASAFRLVESTTSPHGVLVTRYLRDGDVRTGSFAND